MAVSLTQLQTLVRLAELGNFTRTAEELNITPPAVALQMRALSDHYGVSLVDVVKRKPVLTDAGRYLVDRSRAVLDELTAVERDMQRFLPTYDEHFCVGASLTIGNYLLAPLLAAFKREHPHVAIDVHVANPAQLASALRSGAVVAALGAELPQRADFESAPFRKDELILIVPSAGHPFSRRRAVRAADLSGEAFIGREEGSPTRLLVERELAGRGVRLRTELVVPTWEGVTRAVEAGLGIAIVSRLVAERAVAENRLHVVEVRDLDLHRQFTLVTLRGSRLSPHASAFIDFLKSAAASPNGHRGRRAARAERRTARRTRPKGVPRTKTA